MGTRYLSAFPPELFDCFEAIKPVWAPYYTIHKILAGLLDQHIFANNDQALKMVTWMVDYFYKRVQNVIVKYIIEKHWLSLNEETDCMNDVLYRLYTITVHKTHLGTSLVVHRDTNRKLMKLSFPGQVTEFDSPARLLDDKSSMFLKLVSEYSSRSTSALCITI
ncbi:ABC transporter C family member 5 [Camellia lanceoleosa]|uniref:ABC transporter C family member 5 n=1 Tax=Camellia lanceoleosa TaxID=1840588 RepID=A0ACC0GL91_9ERIC|nr:ABC transporter C family member 5 [Camellia lanceoleosa]